jgi:TetR/AcrR family transcriptional regulator
LLAGKRSGRMSVGARTADQASAREQLLDAAAAVMVERRSIEVSLQTIAARANLTGLLRALARRDTERALRQLQSLLEADIPADKMLRMHIRGIIRNYARRPYLNALFNRLLQDPASPSAREIKEELVEPLAAAQSRILEMGIAACLFRPIDPTLAYFLVIGACQYPFNNKVTVDGLLGRELDDATVTRYADFVADTLLRAIAAA